MAETVNRKAQLAVARGGAGNRLILLAD